MVVMFSSSLYSFAIVLLFTCPASIAYDVVVYGATPGGIAAAITAARVSPSFSIVIIEPTSYIGGMSTAGGIGLRDLGLTATSKLTIQIFSCFYLFLNEYSYGFCCTRMGTK
jgi:ribulose 1,5-bisphosphate synthetase/thiazole synthase